MGLSDQQIMNWKLAFPFLAFMPDLMVEEAANLIQLKLNLIYLEEKTRKDAIKRFQRNLHKLIRVGSKFYENGIEKRVSRVTDIVFDSVSSETGEVEVRNLAVLPELATGNKLSIITL